MVPESTPPPAPPNWVSGPPRPLPSHAHTLGCASHTHSRLPPRHTHPLHSHFPEGTPGAHSFVGEPRNPSHRLSHWKAGGGGGVRLGDGRHGAQKVWTDHRLLFLPGFEKRWAAGAEAAEEKAQRYRGCRRENPPGETRFPGCCMSSGGGGQLRSPPFQLVPSFSYPSL